MWHTGGVMKNNKTDFEITVENSLLGFETEQVYRISMKKSNVKICNIFEDKTGVFSVSSVCHTPVNVLIEALKFFKEKING